MNVQSYQVSKTCTQKNGHKEMAADPKILEVGSQDHHYSLNTYSETCANGHLYSETTCIKRPLRDVPKVSALYILTCIQRPPLYKATMKWP